MADLKIFMTYEDFKELSNFLIDSFQAEFFPEQSFEKPFDKGLTNFNEIESHIKNFPKDYSLSYFITSPIWKVEPIYYSFIEKPGKKLYYVEARYGGPSFHFIPSFSFPRTINKKLIIGMISDYSYYISGSFLKDTINGYRTFERPELMKNAFREIRKYVNKNSEKVIYKGKSTKTARLMTNAQKLVSAGYELYEGEIEFK